MYYLSNILFGLIVMFPFRSALMGFAGNSMMGDHLSGRIDMDLLIEFLVRNTTTINSLMTLAMIAAALHGIFTLFLSGGAYVVFASGESYTAARFWGNAANYFGRFVRLFLWSIPALVVFLSIQFIEPLVVRLIWGSDPYQYITWWGDWIRVGMGYIGIAIYLMVFDYARISAILTEESRTRRALWRGVRFTFSHFLATSGISLAIVVAGFLLLLLYYPLSKAMQAPNTLVILVLLIVQQLYIIARMGLRLTLYGSQVHFYQQVNPATPEVRLDSIESVVIQPAPGEQEKTEDSLL